MNISRRLPILLVNMPHVSITTPSASLGRLQGILRSKGTPCEVCYGNLLFAHECGIEMVELELRLRRFNLGDWVFWGKIFPEIQEKQTDYVNRLSRNKYVVRALGHRAGKETRAELLGLIRKTERYVEHLAARILDADPRIVGLTLTVNQLYPVLALLKEIKEQGGIVTLLGGPYCEGAYGLALHKAFPWIDYLVSGEADDVITPLVDALTERGTQCLSADVPFGVLCPEHRRQGYPAECCGNGTDFHIIKAGPTGSQLPDYDDYFRTLDVFPELAGRIKPGLPFEGSRGCWRGEKSPCLFCGDNGARLKYQERQGMEVLSTLDQLYEKYSCTRFVGTDNMMSLRLFDNLIPELAGRKGPYTIFFEITGALKAEQIKCLSDAGIRWLQPGIESLHSRLLKCMNKGLLSWQTVNTLKWCRQYGIDIYWNLLWGMPGDEDSWYGEMADIIPLIEHLQPPRLFNKIKYVRHSAYARSPKKYGLRLVPDTRRLDPMPIPEKLRLELAERFFDLNEPDPLELLLKEGFQKLREKVRWWQKRFRRTPAPMLSTREEGDRIVVRDTRPVARERTVVLEGLTKSVFEAASRPTPPPASRISDELQAYGHHRREIENALSILLESKLILLLDGRCLALACDEKHFRQMPPESENPSGTLREKNKVFAKMEDSSTGKTPPVDY